MANVDEDGIRTRLQAGFAPLQCRVEFRDYGHRCTFIVFDQRGGSVLKMKDILTSELGDTSFLDQVVQSGRRNLESRGYLKA